MRILYVDIDTQRADHLGCYGYPRDTSPRLDKLAAEGVLFERMIAETSWTLPSHVTLLTGLSTRLHGVMHDSARLEEARTTLAELLQAHRYRTEAIVTAPYLHPIFGLAQGFERYEVVGDTVFDQEGFDPKTVAGNDEALQAIIDGDLRAGRARSSDVVVGLVAQSLTRFGDEPFFLFVHMFDVHYDYAPPEPDWRRFDPDYSGSLDASDFAYNEAIHPDMPVADREHLIALYDGEIRWNDRQLGRIVDALDERGLLDRTVVAVIGDHGDEFFEHGDTGHRKTLYDEQLLVPFVMRLPGVLPAGERLAMQVRMKDVTPTLLGLASAASRETNGANLVPFIVGERKRRHLPAVSTLVTGEGAVMTSLRNPGRKVIYTQPIDPASGVEARIEVFNLAAAPGEQKPVTRGPGVAAGQRSLREIVGREERRASKLPRDGQPRKSLGEKTRRKLEALGYIQPRQQSAEPPPEPETTAREDD